MMNRLLFTLVLSGAVVLAQEPAKPGDLALNYDKVKAYLTLTDAQVQQLTTLQTNHAQANRTIYTQLAEQQRILSEHLNSENPNGVTAGNAVVAIANLNRQLRTAAQQNRTAAVAVLTEAQRPKLQQLDTASKLAPEIGQAASLGLLEGAIGIFPGRVFGGGLPAVGTVVNTLDPGN